MGNIGPWQLLIVAALIVLLFGARRLPELARGLGSSLRIFKAETKGMMEDDKKSTPEVTSSTGESARSTEVPRAAQPAPQAESADRQREQKQAGPVHNPVSENVADQLNRDA
jgi:sec-independent protein translocase protein TatA